MNELIEKFLHRNLNAEEAAQFIEMLNNKASLEDVYTNLLLKESFSDSSENDFRQILDEITYEYPYQESASKELLIPSFIPIKDYEENLGGVTRTSDIQILKPIYEGNYIEYLPFRLKKSVPQTLLLIVENNDYDELIRKEIPPDTIAFNIDLPPEKGFLPGRYYWKLASERHQFSAMSMFFIGKGLIS